MDDWSMFSEGQTSALVWNAGKPVLRLSIGPCHQFVSSRRRTYSAGYSHHRRDTYFDQTSRIGFDSDGTPTIPRMNSGEEMKIIIMISVSIDYFPAGFAPPATFHGFGSFLSPNHWFKWL